MTFHHVYPGLSTTSEVIDPTDVFDAVLGLAELNGTDPATVDRLMDQVRTLRGDNVSQLRVQQIECANMDRVMRTNETLTRNNRLRLQQHRNRSSMDSLVVLSAEDPDLEYPTSNRSKRVRHDLMILTARNNMSVDTDIDEELQLPPADLSNRDRPTEMEKSPTPTGDGDIVTAYAGHTTPQLELMSVIAEALLAPPAHLSIGLPDQFPNATLDPNDPGYSPTSPLRSPTAPYYSTATPKMFASLRGKTRQRTMPAVESMRIKHSMMILCLWTRAHF